MLRLHGIANLFIRPSLCIPTVIFITFFWLIFTKTSFLFTSSLRTRLLKTIPLNSRCRTGRPGRWSQLSHIYLGTNQMVIGFVEDTIVITSNLHKGPLNLSRLRKWCVGFSLLRNFP